MADDNPPERVSDTERLAAIADRLDGIVDTLRAIIDALDSEEAA